MRWTRCVATGAILAALSGCAYGYQSQRAVARYDASERPVASYYCYDCHGDRYFDPYYDWCTSYGFRYRWESHPEAVASYRERYLRIREVHPRFGRYRYPGGYRGSTRYKAPRDYDTWRSTRPPSRGAPPGKPKVREQDREDQGRKTRGRDREKPREPESHASSTQGA